MTELHRVASAQTAVRLLADESGCGQDRQMSAPLRPRWIEIDLLKGCAILWVLMIHSKPLGESWVYMDLVNRAVPLFLIAFGLNSRLWWRGRTLAGNLRTWYRTRVRRILVPYWASLVVWWALVLWYRPADVPLTWRLPFVQALGYTQSIGSGGFVTLILPLVALFPYLDAARRRVGIVPLLIVAMAGEMIVARHGVKLFLTVGFLNYYAFPFRLLGHVVFGMLLATRLDRIGLLAGGAGVVLWALCAIVQQGVLWPGLSAYAAVAIDLPLSVALLAGLRPFARLPVAAPALAWLGVSSWGIYLGQMLVHDAVMYRCGFIADLTPHLAACHFPFAGSGSGLPLDRWLYTLMLLVGALGFVWLGGQLLRLSAALRRAGAPLPDLKG